MFGLSLLVAVPLVLAGIRLLDVGGRLLNGRDRVRARVDGGRAGPFRTSQAPPLEMEIAPAEPLRARLLRLATAITLLALSVVLMGTPFLLPFAALFLFE